MKNNDYLTVLAFKTEGEYLEWQEGEGNTIYSLATPNGFIGDIREENLIPFWNENKIVSFDNPTNEEEQKLIDSHTWTNATNWGVLPQYEQEVTDKLVKIIIENS